MGNVMSNDPFYKEGQVTGNSENARAQSLKDNDVDLDNASTNAVVEKVEENRPEKEAKDSE